VSAKVRHAVLFVPFSFHWRPKMHNFIDCFFFFLPFTINRSPPSSRRTKFTSSATLSLGTCWLGLPLWWVRTSRNPDSSSPAFSLSSAGISTSAGSFEIIEPVWWPPFGGLWLGLDDPEVGCRWGSSNGTQSSSDAARRSTSLRSADSSPLAPSIFYRRVNDAEYQW
jgi:hypothetical protein